MNALSRDYLKSLGIEFKDDSERASFIDHYHTFVLKRAIDRVIKELDDQQIIELNALKNQNDDEIRTWLVANVPEFRDIVKEEVHSLIGEISDKKMVS